MSDGDRLEGEAAEAFVCACFALAREAVMTPARFELAVRSLEQSYTERPLLPAPTLALDLSALLLGERLAPVHPPSVEPVRDALRGYEDHVLARLTADRRWTRLQEAIVAAPAELRPVAIGIVVEQLMTRLGLTGGTGVSQAIVRRLGTKPTGEVLDVGRAALFDVEVAGRVAEGLTLLARAARRTRELITDAEVFIAENVAALKGLGPRVALAQLAEVAQAVGERLPTRLRGRAFEDGDAPTQLEEESAYPVGGFSSISTAGSIENLVTSELIYMDDAGSERPDLFDVRFVEGELLYYSRDESVAIRRRRTLVLMFDPSLAQARVLDAGEDYQRLVWALGSAAALVRKLSEWLDTEALRFELVFTRQGGELPLAEEQSVLGLLLREYRVRGQLDVIEAGTTAEAIRTARETHRTRARVMLFGAKMPGGLDGLSRPDAFVDAGAKRPVVHWLDAANTGEAEIADALGAWEATTRQLLDGLLRRHRPPKSR